MSLSPSIPPPPKGFVLDDDESPSTGIAPPPPKGFTLDAGPFDEFERKTQATAIGSVPKPGFFSWQPRAMGAPWENAEGGFAPAGPTKTLGPVKPSEMAGVLPGAVATTGLGAEAGEPSPAVATTKGLQDVGTPGRRGLGALELANVAGEATTPIIGPAALENPGRMLVGLGEATVASKGAEYATKKAGATPETQQQVSNLAWLLPMLLRAGIRPEVQSGHNVETGNPAAQVTTRGGFGAGIEVTPDEVIIKGGTVSNPKEMRIPRSPQAGPLTTQGPTIQGQTVPPPVPPVSSPVQPSAAPVGPENPAGGPALPPMHEITAQDVAEVGDVIAKLPPEMRAQATLDTHTKLAELLLQQGKLVGPDGKLQIISNQKQAESLAQKLINEEIGRQDAQTKKAATEPIPAPPPGFTLDQAPGEAKAEETPTFAKGDRVTLPKGDTGTVAHINSKLIRVALDGGGKASVPVENWGKVQKVAVPPAEAAQEGAIEGAAKADVAKFLKLLTPALPKPAVALGPAAVIATAPAVVATAVPKASASVGPAKTIDQVIDEAIQKTLAPPADISALKAALAASTGVPMEYDRRLLGTCRTLLQRDLTGDERREMRSLFKKKLLTL